MSDHKDKFLTDLRRLYLTMNYADDMSHKTEVNAEWMHPDMAGSAGCQHIDRMLHDMVAIGALAEEEREDFHDGRWG